MASGTSEEFVGKVFCITGALSMVRRDFEKLLVRHGGRVAKSMTKEVTHLVSAAKGTVKCRKAEEQGCVIVDEAWVMNRITGINASSSSSGAPNPPPKLSTADVTVKTKKRASVREEEATAAEVKRPKVGKEKEDEEEEQELPLVELLGPKLLGPGGPVETASLTADVVCIYFGGSWCPPCRKFAPKLVEWVSELKNLGKSIECVHVSCDRSESAFEDYFATMKGFYAVPYLTKERRLELRNEIGIPPVIPTLVFVDQDGHVFEKDGRNVVSSDPKGQRFPWAPKLRAVVKKEFDGKSYGTIYNLVERKLVEEYDWLCEFSAEGSPVVLYRFENEIDALRGAVDANFKWFRHVIENEYHDEDGDVDDDDRMRLYQGVETEIVAKISPEKIKKLIGLDLGLDCKSPQVDWDILASLSAKQLKKLIAFQRRQLATVLRLSEDQYPPYVGMFWVEEGSVFGGEFEKVEGVLDLPKDVLKRIGTALGARKALAIEHTIDVSYEDTKATTFKQPSYDIFTTHSCAEKAIAQKCSAPHELDAMVERESSAQLEFQTADSKVVQTSILTVYNRNMQLPDAPPRP